jgi:hypothetical protein
MAKRPTKIVWTAQPGPQEAAIRAPFIEEMLYGGAAGGGKSDFLLGDYLADVDQGFLWQGILFRQSFPALDDLVVRGLELFTSTGAKWLEGKKEFRWPNGAVLRLRHFESIADFVKYQGHRYSWIGWDELGEWPDGQCYHRMKSRLRGSARHKRIRGTANPGGVGHQWIQDYFKIPPSRTTYKESKVFVDPVTKMTRTFIPSRVQDNKILTDSDPGYIDRLRGVGDAELVKAWLEGDWSALVGAYFASDWSKVEMADSFDIPTSWRIYAGLDYGEASPTAWIMGAVDYDRNLWLINEYYEKDRAASEHAAEIRSMMENYPFTIKRPAMTISDPSMFARRRISKGEAQVTSASDAFRDNKIPLRPGNNNRINGWRILRDIMAKGKLKIFRDWCPNTIRTLPALPRDPRRPEDVQTDAEDHAADALRYMAVHIYGPHRAKALAAKADSDRILAMLATDEALTRYG